ncbi:MAG: MBL fold metallo-hydrolase [bacterium]
MALEVRYIKATTHVTKNFSYFVFDRDAKDCVMIDPAGDPEQINSFLSNNHITLSKVLLSHYHADHVYLADYLAQEYDMQVFMLRTEIKYYGFDCKNLSAISDRDQILCGRYTINAIHTPGHTKGSTCYLAGNHLFTGDTLFIEGCGICFGKGADPEDMFHSLQYLKTHIDPQTCIYPGHSYGKQPGKTFAYLLQNNIYLQIDDREQFIAFRMRKNQNKLFHFK